MVRTNCFAYSREKDICKALEILDCKDCKFYKNKYNHLSIEKVKVLLNKYLELENLVFQGIKLDTQQLIQFNDYRNALLSYSRGCDSDS